MNAKERVRNDILVGMGMHLEACTMQILDAIIIRAIQNVAMYYIQEYLKDRGVTESSKEPLFTHLRGDKTKVLDVDGVYVSIKDIARRAGMDRSVYPHLFRKTTATNICRRGGSEDAAGEYLGHAPRNITGKHYTYKGDRYVEQIFRSYVEAV